MTIKTHLFKPFNIYGLFVATLLVLAVATATIQTQVRAAAGSIYLSPANTTLAVNSTVTVNLRINPGTAVTVVEATVGFDPSKLQYLGATTSSSPFDTNVKQTVGGSSLQFSRAKLDAGGISTDSLIASITFKALAASGTSSLSVTGANAAFNGAYTNPGASGATITFSPGSCPSGQTGTPPNCRVATVAPKPPSVSAPSTKPVSPKPSGMTAPAPNAPTEAKPQDSKPTPNSAVAKPKITKQEAAYTKVNINATTEEAGQVLVRYGTNKDTLTMQTSLTSSSKNHTITLDKGLSPGMKLYYVVVAQNAEGVTSQTDVQTVSTKGMAVKLALLGEDLKPLRNQKVTVEPLGISATSDGDGYVRFDTLPPGDFTVIATINGVKHSEHLNVVSNVETANGMQSSEEQSKAIVYSGVAAAKSGSPVVYAAIALVALVIAGIAIFVVLRRHALKNMIHRLPFRRSPTSAATASSGVVGSGESPVGPTQRPIAPLHSTDTDTTLWPNTDPNQGARPSSSLPHSSSSVASLDDERRV